MKNTSIENSFKTQGTQDKRTNGQFYLLYNSINKYEKKN